MQSAIRPTNHCYGTDIQAWIWNTSLVDAKNRVTNDHMAIANERVDVTNNQNIMTKTLCDQFF